MIQDALSLSKLCTRTHQSKGDEADAVLIMIDGTGKKKKGIFHFY